EQSGLIIAPEQLSNEALQGLIEEFITREGTDYGAVEWSLAQKVEQVHAQLRRGDALIVFDVVAESCTILPRDQARAYRLD
ncbi:MAG TPA: YheU family protein, partial [Spongiibacteraceae bacterium]|nr:YheU family protein [Spongiibacteraceae bacterium]